jgi:hypothetical protein
VTGATRVSQEQTEDPQRKRTEAICMNYREPAAVRARTSLLITWTCSYEIRAA